MPSQLTTKIATRYVRANQDIAKSLIDFFTKERDWGPRAEWIFENKDALAKMVQAAGEDEEVAKKWQGEYPDKRWPDHLKKDLEKADASYFEKNKKSGSVMYAMAEALTG